MLGVRIVCTDTSRSVGHPEERRQRLASPNEADAMLDIPRREGKKAAR
jgi:hypothetical protein